MPRPLWAGIPSIVVPSLCVGNAQLVPVLIIFVLLFIVFIHIYLTLCYAAGVREDGMFFRSLMLQFLERVSCLFDIIFVGWHDLRLLAL